MLVIHCSEHSQHERLYIYKLILEDWLGLAWSVEHTERPDVCITNTANNNQLIMPDSVLNRPNFNLSIKEVNDLMMDAGNNKMPTVTRLNGKSKIKLTKDVFGLSFLILTRYEEYLSAERDEHDRFPASASVSYRSDLLSRPLVDEWVELLWACLQQLWPGLERRISTAKTLVSCDVDSPYENYVNSFSQLIKQCGADLIIRKDFVELRRKVTNYLKSKLHDYSHDKHNTFTWMMDVNEDVGNKIVFYFIVNNANRQYDAHYNINEPRIRKLIRDIYDRGHEVGLHASYDSYKNSERLAYEFEILKTVLDEEGVQQREIGVRQHYLRWSPSHTAAYQNAAGLAYDTSMSYADSPGFRCGTSHEFTMFDLKVRRPLEIKQRPLIVMEGSVINYKYLGLGYSKQAIDLMLNYKKRCYQYNGSFTLLWHNSHFGNEADKRFYLELIK